MSDRRLRELERRWQETGSPDDEAAYLLERVRVGDLTRERLELAAYCGHEAAKRGSGRRPPALAVDPWIVGLDRGWGPGVLVRAALAATRFVYPRWARGLSGELRDADWVTGALRAAERCVLDPSEVTRAVARRAARDADDAVSQCDDEDRPEVRAAEACALVARAASGHDSELAVSAIRACARLDAVLPVVQEELIAWALGAFDPLLRWKT